MHLVGMIDAAGLTLEAFEEAVELRLGQVLVGPVSAIVDVAEWRPVAVLGDVAEPGLFPYSSNLDVMRAVAQARGLFAFDGSTPQAMRIAEEERNSEVLRKTLAALLVEEARLLAEREGGKDVAVLPEVTALVGEAEARRLFAEQGELLARRDELLAIRTSGEKDREALARLEAKSFAERRALSQRQVDLTLQDLDDQKLLMERGLGIASRLLDLNLTVDQYRSNELEAAAFEAAALQNASSAASSARGLVSTHHGEISERLFELSTQILATRAELTGSERFLATFGGIAAPGADAPPRYLVTRRIDGIARTFDADASSLLQPGDALEVLLAVPSFESEPGGNG